MLLVKLNFFAMMLLQQEVGFDLRTMWSNMGAPARGVVVLEAEISKEGTIDNLKVITGHPLLIQAAIDAVKQWRYKPTMLNNEPVPVVTTITVNFAFAQ